MKTRSRLLTNAQCVRFCVGPLRIEANNERISISRADLEVVQQLIIRTSDEHKCTEASINSTFQGTLSSERVIGRSQTLSIRNAVESITAPLRETAPQGRPTSAEDLDRGNYSILMMQDEAWRAILARFMGQDGMPHLSQHNIEEFIPHLLDTIDDSLYPPTLLDHLARHGVINEPLIAIADLENQSTMLWIRWNAITDSWVAFPFLPQDVPLSSMQRMGEALITQLRTVPRLAYFIREAVAELRLEGWIDNTSLATTYQQALVDFADSSTFESIAHDYHVSVYETEHHHSLSRLATSIATATLPSDRPAETLQKVHALHTDYAIRTLVDRTEMALGRFKRRLTTHLSSTNQHVYKKIEKMNPQRPDECLQAFDIAGARPTLLQEIREHLFLPTQIRHMWTHRGKLLDADFFKQIGRNGAKSAVERVFGRDVELHVNHEFPLADEDVRWFSRVVTVLIDKLYTELRTITAGSSGSPAALSLTQEPSDRA